MHACMHLCPVPPCDSCQPCDSFPQLSTLLPRSTHPCMHAFLSFCSLPPRSTLDSARYAAIASTVHLSHNCGQICDRNCDKNCDANFGPDQLHDRIHFRIRSTFSVHVYAQEHTSNKYITKKKTVLHKYANQYCTWFRGGLQLLWLPLSTNSAERFTASVAALRGPCPAFSAKTAF